MSLHKALQKLMATINLVKDDKQGWREWGSGGINKKGKQDTAAKP